MNYKAQIDLHNNNRLVLTEIETFMKSLIYDALLFIKKFSFYNTIFL